ncbi:hypothetical protein MMYC01_202008 [Madurella mycetomatis]|uniref:Uncharacterized protein n=1 Tax=Madurella mycetomatis TaxID=100816 RepID=A0A175WDA6_9PEZI|nr:hypothetical protein MMYC01_204867 [Madurella mycetomatis]KXX81635.1 hypothetical protein MMYC01_202008 [Madurella mycetomatis]
MDCSGPPSYQDATKRLDWLELVAPYVQVKEYACLCLVSSRFYHQFAPRLWNDPLNLEWFYRFMRHMGRVRAGTRTLVFSLDLRRFVMTTSDFALYSWGKTLSETLRMLPSTFPKLRCILLDGHPDIETDALLDTLSPGPLLLSIPQCEAKLPNSFFASPCMKSLVYLDVSGMPGSLRNPLVQKTLSPVNLPNLRILKAQSREMDDSTATLLFRTFKEQLWSIDLSHNKLTDAIFGDMQHFAFPALSSRTGDFAIEGRLTHPPGEGSASFGKFCFVKESDWSATFSHPQRYLADAPAYTRNAHDPLQGITNARLDGRARIRPDSPGAVKAMLSGGPGDHSPSQEDINELDICQGHHGTTHLYLNGNNISAGGLARMIRSSPGQLQHLECESMSFTVHEAARPAWLAPGKAKISGILDLAHVFRPVFSSNLQVLRIHHSLVTQLLTLELEGVSSMANLWLAETCLLPRAEMAYPEAFVPDMNPRLQSLVLTQIPRYSTGRLIEKLINFLKLASIQERAIQDVKVNTRRGPSTLRGLRHIRLEFEPDPREAEALFGEGADDEDGLDPEGLLSQEFSFFGSSSWSSSSKKPPISAGRHPATAAAVRPRNEPELRNNSSQESARRLEQHPPSPHPPAETAAGGSYLTFPCDGGNPPLTVWIGSPTATAFPAVREYTRSLAPSNPSSSRSALHADPAPSSPAHVAAGVPQGSYIFPAAWEAMLFPADPPHLALRTGREKPSRADLREMRDVVAAIKEYRAGTRAAYDRCSAAARDGEGGESRLLLLGAPHFHWTGRLEVSMVDPARHFHQSRYWR